MILLTAHLIKFYTVKLARVTTPEKRPLPANDQNLISPSNTFVLHLITIALTNRYIIIHFTVANQLSNAFLDQ